jgi:hypothetical protein
MVVLTARETDQTTEHLYCRRTLYTFTLLSQLFYFYFLVEATKSELIGIMETVCLVIKQAILMVFFVEHLRYCTIHGLTVQPNPIVPRYNKTVCFKKEHCYEIIWAVVTLRM